jgi:hypothetical protein
VREDGAGDPQHGGADQAGVDPVAGHVDAGQLGGELAVAERTERPPDVGALERPEHHQEDHQQAQEQVVGGHPLPQEGVLAGGDDQAGLAARQLPLAQHQVGEGEGEGERHDPGEDHAQRAAHRDPAEQPPQGRGQRRGQRQPHGHGKPGLLGEDGGGIAAHPRERADAQEQLVGAAEDHVEGDRVGPEHEGVHGQPHHQPRVAQPQGDQGEHGAGDGDRPEGADQRARRPGAHPQGRGLGLDRRVELDRHRYLPSSPRGRMTMVSAAAASSTMVVMYCPM